MKNYFLIFVLIISLITVFGCTRKPDKELAEARQAIIDAQSAGANIYAEKEFVSAKQLFEDAKKSIEDKDFATAKDKALEALKSAEQAKEIATKEKINLKRDMEKALVELKAIINSITPSDSSATKKLEVAKELAKEAEDAFNAGSFDKAKQKINAAKFLAEELTGKLIPKEEQTNKPEGTEAITDTIKTDK